VAERLCKEGFYYPSSASLTKADIHFIVEATKAAYELTKPESLNVRA
jgi:hypothetical protein